MAVRHSSVPLEILVLFFVLAPTALCNPLVHRWNVAPYISGSEHAFPQTWPVVVNMGPVMDFDLDDEDLFDLFDTSALKTFSLMNSDIGLAGEPDSWVAPHDAVQTHVPKDRKFASASSIVDILHENLMRSPVAEEFHVSQQRGDNGLSKLLQVYLPHYIMHSDGFDTVDEPLSVEIVGRSLVVRGWKASETTPQTIRRFQRSFQLPEVADVDAIHVTYNLDDETLTVEIPSKKVDGMADIALETNFWNLDQQNDGSHTAIILGCVGGSDSSGIQVLSELRNALSGEHLGPQSGDQRFKSHEHQQIGDKLLAVHRKDARAFWRLADDSSRMALEVVVPRNIDLGKAMDKSILMYNKTDSGLRGSQVPIGKLNLPVDINQQDCAWDRSSEPSVPFVALICLCIFSAIVSLAWLSSTWPQHKIAADFTTRQLHLRRLLKVVTTLLFVSLLYGLTLLLHATSVHERNSMERILRCTMNQDDVKKMDIHVRTDL